MGGQLWEFGVDLGFLRGDMTIRLPAFEGAPRAASFAHLITKIACRLPFEIHGWAPKIGVLGQNWVKMFSLGNVTPQRADTCGDASFELLCVKICSQIFGVGE